MPLRRIANSIRPRSSGDFELQLFIRTVVTPLPPRPDAGDRIQWPRLIAVAFSAVALPLIVAALIMVVKAHYS